MLTRLMQLKSWRLGVQAGFVVVLAMLLLGATTDTGTRFSDLGHRLMCTCGCGQVLLECNHVGCQSSDRMRGELMGAMKRGDNDEQVLASFVEKYGPVVLAAPTKTGFNRVAWLMPYLTLLAGIVVTAGVVRAWRTRSKARPAASSAGVDGATLDTLRRRVHEDTEI